VTLNNHPHSIRIHSDIASGILLTLIISFEVSRAHRLKLSPERGHVQHGVRAIYSLWAMAIGGIGMVYLATLKLENTETWQIFQFVVGLSARHHLFLGAVIVLNGTDILVQGNHVVVVEVASIRADLFKIQR